MLDAPTAGPRRRGPVRWFGRTAAIGVVLVAIGASLWGLTTSPTLGGRHSDDQVEEIGPSVVEDAGIGQALADLHGHINWTIWGRGELDQAAWTETLRATVAALAEAGRTDLANELALAGDLLGTDASLHRIHDRIEAIELRYASERQPGDEP